MSDDLKLKHSFTCIISGPSVSGKPSFCVRFLQNLDALCTKRDFDGGVFWCYCVKTAVPSPTDLPKRDVHFNEGVPTEFENARARSCFVILDDLLKGVYCKQVYDLFTKGGHHRNISMILFTQNLFQQGRYCRDISLNAKYLVLLKNVRDKNQFMFFARQVYRENSASLYKAYLDANKRPHEYLLLDLSQDTDTTGFIYCDLISPQYVGTSLARSMRTFIYPSFSGQHLFDNVCSLPVEKRT